MVTSRRAVFLDRDGVLVRSDVSDGKAYAVRTLDAFQLHDDAARACALLAEAGFLLIVVTNQPDVGNGLTPRETVEEMNRRLAAALPLDLIKVCYHAQTDTCTCRKPKPGMILAAAKELGIDTGASYMVGDRSSDVACGQAAGCHTVFIDRAYAEPLRDRPDAIVASMDEAACHILTHFRGTADK